MDSCELEALRIGLSVGLGAFVGAFAAMRTAMLVGVIRGQLPQRVLDEPQVACKVKNSIALNCPACGQHIQIEQTGG